MSKQPISTWPVVKENLEGFVVRKHIPNMSSIEATLSRYRTVISIRAVPFSAFPKSKTPHDMFYSASDIRRSEKLADDIEKSGEINPLIVVIDGDGAYILEGAHRFVALQILGLKSFPALVILDQD